MISHTVEPRPRDGWLDAIRAIALIRVIFWHTFGAPFITYLVAAVPAMFFVTGSLFAKSTRRRPVVSVVRDRLARILIPLWVFATVALGAMAVANIVSPEPTRQTVRGLWAWFIPLTDPRGTAWEGGHLSAPLWYIRTLFWVFLLSPLLLTLARRRPAWLLGGLISAVFALDLIGRPPSLVLRFAPNFYWQLGDVALFTIFFVLGALHRWGRQLTTAQYAGGAFAMGVLGAAWILTQPVPLYVVNNSHAAHLFVGLGWLGVMLAGRPQLDRLAHSRIGGKAIAFLSQRSLTIYLWHSTAIVISFLALRHAPALPPGVWNAALAAGTVAVTALLVVIFGRVEDLASSRPPRWWPAKERRPMYVAATAGLCLLILAAASLSMKNDGTQQVAAARRIPVPSQAPPKPQFEPVAVDVQDTVATTRRPPVAATPAAEAIAPAADDAWANQLDDTLRQWIARSSVTGVEVGVARPDEFVWTDGYGIDADGVPVTRDTRFEIGSITKSFTAVIMMQLIDQGVIALDEPLPVLSQVPDFPYYGQITVRDLLFHRSGLVNYRDTPDAVADPFSIVTPADAVRSSGRQPLKFAPGSKVDYSSTNYLLLGMLIEDRTGQSFDELLRRRLLEPLGLTSVVHLPSQAAAPNFSTAGIMMTSTELLDWVAALYRDQQVVSANGFALMTTIDKDVGVGAGTYGYCPCTVTPDEAYHFHWIGHSGGTTIARYAPAEDLVVTVNLTSSVWTPEMVAATNELFELIRNLVNTRDAIRTAASHPTSDAIAPVVPDANAPAAADAPAE